MLCILCEEHTGDAYSRIGSKYQCRKCCEFSYAGAAKHGMIKYIKGSNSFWCYTYTSVIPVYMYMLKVAPR